MKDAPYQSAMKNLTPFAIKVYDVVRKIPKGKTLTYSEVAEKIGKPNAVRAVGSVLGKNRDPRVPCHRVIRTDGSMGGYAWGIPKKIQILKEEGAL